MGQHHEAPETAQLSWISEAAPDAREAALPPSPDRFLRGDPDRLFIGETPLRDYLTQAGKGWAPRFRERLFEQDATPFYDKYKACGRKPYHPFMMLGLILYGAQMGRWSLRELEDLAKLDLGAWWVCGGLQPDHSTIGQFIHLHADVLTEEFFIALTSRLVERLGVSHGTVAGDGTVIEAASSRFSMLKREAAQEALKRAKQAKGADSAEATKRREVLETVEARDADRARKGRNKHPARVCPEEPEAVVQPRKDGVRRPSYKPSILADKHRLIVGQQVHGASEPAAVEPMLAQYCDIFGKLPETSLWDGGYNTFAVLELSVSLDMDVLCGVEPDRALSEKKRFLKSAFRYDEAKDVYVCPAGRTLTYRRAGQAHGRRYREYHCRACEGCEQRKRCTQSKAGRSVLRYEGEELKEALREVMSHPAAKKRLRCRKAMVEPPFGVLRYRQGLNRFHRKGLKKVRVEFSLHCMAYNLKRAIRLEALALAVFVGLLGVERGENRVCGFHIVVLSPNAGFVVTMGAKITPR